LGLGGGGLAPPPTTPNPQSPIPNPQQNYYQIYDEYKK